MPTDPLVHVKAKVRLFQHVLRWKPSIELTCHRPGQSLKGQLRDM
jgi:hypothetical protein